MRALVVVSHPDRASFNHAVARTIESAWFGRGVATELVDLHAICFDPALSVAEARGTASDDTEVQRQIDLLAKADLLAVVHPNCWGSPPAMMKGWMDRVFAPGAAYAFAKGGDDGAAPVGLWTGKRALVVNTSNTTAEREHSTFGDPLERIWRDCLLTYCGFSQVERLIFRVVASSTPASRNSWLRATKQAALLLIDH